MNLRSAAPALAAALLFGASTPLAKLLLGDMPPQLLAGLLYLGSGAGLALLMVLRKLRAGAAVPDVRIPRADLPWLLGAIAAGGVAGPVLLMFGLQRLDAASAALLLNLEGVFTALLAWVVFRENADRSIVLGMAAIVAGGLLLAWTPGAGLAFSAGAGLVAAACLAWAIDNNLTRKVATHDALLIAGLKGALAGAVNTAAALGAGASLPPTATVAAAMSVGFVGYGLSLALFVVALRNLGTARTGAYFSVAPLFGVLIALAIWPQWPAPAFWLAAALMALGVWLHVRERHVHAHTHEPMDHAHRHRHDAHHQHTHDFPWDGREPHTHPHHHAALTHTHAHVPDIHHRHGHG
ncbi:DMT family transporter [Thiomonas bhubaneswarensis]|uniref:Permease of the drug/metabolite transporter (DMT) superfamily n=1 Tax=Thiomonas bhubaneswarensis TaxID=339866 RepID=A0A0K6HUY5_9BURK|nr:DMT family transporter [Thiomonas bhubaneswarensis]CUA94641.1 Permease of the drug/metabolite transporter (DMT) superfamily [Thiomonas bhubaneswarensis]